MRTWRPWRWKAAGEVRRQHMTMPTAASSVLFQDVGAYMEVYRPWQWEAAGEV